MKLSLLALFATAICLAGCAATSVSENGKKVFQTQANASRLVYRSPAGSYLEIEGLNHSTPTRAGGSVIGTAGTAVAGVAATYFTGGVIR